MEAARAPDFLGASCRLLQWLSIGLSWIFEGFTHVLVSFGSASQGFSFRSGRFRSSPVLCYSELEGPRGGRRPRAKPAAPLACFLVFLQFLDLVDLVDLVALVAAALVALVIVLVHRPPKGDPKRGSAQKATFM